MNKRVAAGIGTILTVLLPLAACSLHSAATHEKLSVGRVALPVVALTHIAEAQGYFSDEGVDVVFTDFATGREALTSTCSGEQNLAIAFTTPVAHDIVSGDDLVILTALHESSHNTAVVALTSRGIHEPADLAGKTIGVVKGTSGEFFLDVLLTDNGIEASSIVRKEISIVETLSELKEGRVDAVVAWNPYLYQIKQEWPEDQLRIFTSEVYVEMSLLVGLRGAVAEKEEAIVRFLRALTRAQNLLNSHSLQARHAASLGARGAAHIEPNSPMWNDFTVRLALNHVMLLTLEQEAEWMLSKGLAQGSLPEFRDQVTGAYLRAILPEAVTLPRNDAPRTSSRLHADSSAHTP